MNKKITAALLIGMFLFIGLATASPLEMKTIVKNEKEPLEILPAIAIVRCRWKTKSYDAGERTIHFWVVGYGHHELEWDTLDDHDGDGDWDYIYDIDTDTHTEPEPEGDNTILYVLVIIFILIIIFGYILVKRK